MFDLQFSYDINTPIKRERTPSNGELYSIEYKVKTTNNIPYYIRIEIFKHDVYFIKFYPKRFHLSKKKYKLRLKNVNELSRLVSTCIKVAKEIAENVPNATFGFYGQWDDIDIERKSENSQRYKIYQRAIASKISKNQYDHIIVNKLNLYFLVPKECMKNGKWDKIINSFDGTLENSISELPVPKEATY